MDANAEKVQEEMTVKDYTLCFITYSVIGWLYEVALCLIEGCGFVNRGFCFGPWLPVYGVGGLLILVLCRKFSPEINPIFLVFASALFAALVELLTTYALDITGVGFETLWDYHDEFANFQGRIALIPAFRFGILAMFILKLVQPWLEKISSRVPKAVVFGLAFVFLADVITHIVIGSNYA